MFVKLDSELTPFEPHKKKITHPAAGYIKFEELAELQEVLKIDSVLIEHFSDSAGENTLSVWENYSFGVINIAEVENVFNERDTIGFYISEKLFLVVEIYDKDNSTCKAFQSALNQTLAKDRSIARLFNKFFKELIKSHGGVYRKFMERLEHLETLVWDKIEEDSSFESELLKINRELLVLLNYYDQLEDFFSELEENENGIFTEKELSIISLAAKRTERYGSNIKILREYSNRLRESYQARLDLHLNKIMKIFTVVTTIFLPLTLVAGWYGMNFTNMPELSWKYGYTTVIILSLAIVIFGLYFFKKKKLI